MSWLFDKVPEDVINKAGAIEYRNHVTGQESAADLMPIERIDSPEEIMRIISEPRLTLQVRETIVRCLRKGMFPETAAARAGIKAEQLNRWFAQGLKDLEPYASFYRECIEAEAAWEEEINDKLQNDTDALKFILERRASRPLLSERAAAGGVRYRKQQALEIQASHQHGFTALSVEQRRAMLEELAAQSQLPPAPGVPMEMTSPPPKENVIDASAD